MFCHVCGTEFDETRVDRCPRCGCQVIGKASQTPEQITVTQLKPSIFKKVCILSLPLVVGILLAVVLFYIFGENTGGAKKIAVTATQYYVGGEIDQYYDLLAPSYKEYMMGAKGWFRNEEELKKELLDSSEKLRSTITAECGSGVRVKCTAVSEKKFDEEKLNSVRRELSRDFDYNADEIQSIAEVTVSIETSEAENGPSWKKDMACVKIGGKWYIHHPGFA